MIADIIEVDMEMITQLDPLWELQLQSQVTHQQWEQNNTIEEVISVVEILGNHLSHTTKDTILNRYSCCHNWIKILKPIAFGKKSVFKFILHKKPLTVFIFSRIINHHNNTTILIEVGMTEIHQTIPHIILATQTAILLPTICLEGPRQLKRPCGLKDDH